MNKTATKLAQNFINNRATKNSQANTIIETISNIKETTNNKTIYTDKTTYTFYNTIIATLSYNKKYTTLKLNAWLYETKTTKDRLNAILEQIRYSNIKNWFKIKQEKWVWYIIRFAPNWDQLTKVNFKNNIMLIL